jgi:hypothetical protein
MGASVPKQVSDLVERFDRDRKVFLSPDYKEEQLRAELGQRTGRLRFLNPFFTALGWDMDDALDKILARHWGSVPLFPRGSIPLFPLVSDL